MAEGAEAEAVVDEVLPEAESVLLDAVAELAASPPVDGAGLPEAPPRKSVTYQPEPLS